MFLVTNVPRRAIEPHSGLKSYVFGDGFFPIVRIRQNSAIYRWMVEHAPRQKTIFVNRLLRNMFLIVFNYYLLGRTVSVGRYTVSV